VQSGADHQVVTVGRAQAAKLVASRDEVIGGRRQRLLAAAGEDREAAL
jgi:hypothetical protein